MPTFHYQAKNREGRAVTGTTEAPTVIEAVTRLEAEGLTLQSIGLAPEERLAAPQTTPAPPALAEASGLLAESVQRLLAHREEILPPLGAYIDEQPAGRRRRELRQIVDRIHSGEAASVAAATADPIAWAPLLAAAATDDPPASLFARFVQRERPEIELRQRRSLAMTYPLFLIGLVGLVGWPITSFIVPQFRDIFDDFGLELPAVSELVLGVSEFLNRGGLVLLFAGVTAVWLLWRFGGRLVPGWLRRPLAWLTGGRQGRAVALASLTRHTADLIEARLPDRAALAAAARHVDATHGRSGGRYTEAADRGATAPGLSATIAHAFATEMPTESRVRLLHELSACHADLTGGRVSWARGAAGPATICVLGLVIGMVVLALFMPLVKLIEGLT